MIDDDHALQQYLEGPPNNVVWPGICKSRQKVAGACVLCRLRYMVNGA